MRAKRLDHAVGSKAETFFAVFQLKSAARPELELYYLQRSKKQKYPQVHAGSPIGHPLQL